MVRSPRSGLFSATARLPWMRFEAELQPGFARHKEARNLSAAPVVGQPDIPEVNGASMFWEARLKVYRARYHTHTASAIWEIFANLENSMMRVEFDATDGLHHLRTSPIGVPFDLRLAIGDALRNLRSALDYCVSSMARKAGLPDDHTQFPFNEKRDEVVASFEERPTRKGGKRQGALLKVSQAYPDLEDLILNKIQPFPASEGAGAMGDFLWRLITMDNVDKHRLITPQMTFNFVKKGHIAGVGLERMGFSNLGPGSSPISVRAPAEAKSELDYAVDVVFPEGTRLAGKPVIGAFVEGANFVSEVIGLFEATFDPKTT